MENETLGSYEKAVQEFSIQSGCRAGQQNKPSLSVIHIIVCNKIQELTSGNMECPSLQIFKNRLDKYL